MGTFRVVIEIGDPTGVRWLEVEAVADTGATYTSVPANILEDLSVVRHVAASFVLADGREVQRDIGHAWIRGGGGARGPPSTSSVGVSRTAAPQPSSCSTGSAPPPRTGRPSSVPWAWATGSSWPPPP